MDEAIHKENLIYSIKQSITIINTYKYDDPISQSYSNKYRAILKPFYDNTEDSFSVVTIDFDKLGPKNEIHGKEKMDQAIQYILLQIRCLLPNTIITKYLSGDEYFFILSGFSKEEAQKEFEKISRFLKDEKEKYETHEEKYIQQKLNTADYENTTYGLTMTMEILDNKEKKNLSTLLKSGFDGVCKKKELRNNPSIPTTNDWDKINFSINGSIDEFYHDLRVSKNIAIPFDTFTKTMLPLFTTLAVDTLLENPKKEIDDFEREDIFSPKEALNIHYLLENIHTFSVEQYSTSELETLKDTLLQVKDLLLREPLSHMTSKSVFKKHLLDQFENIEQKYKEFYVSSIGVKAANRLHPYAYTDSLIQDVAYQIKNAFDENISFVEDPYHFQSGDNIMIDQGGGNFSLFIKEDDAPSDKAFQDIIHNINQRPENPKDKLLLTYSSAIIPPNQNKEQVLQLTRDLRQHCSRQKDNLKIKSLCKKSPILKDDLAKLFVYDMQAAKKVFYDSSLNFDDLSIQKKFIEKIIYGIFDKFNHYITVEEKNSTSLSVLDER